MRTLTAIALMASAAAAQDLTKFRVVRELASTQRFVPSADRAFVICDKGVMLTTDWSLTGSVAGLRDLQLSTHPDYLIALTHGDGLWIYSSKTLGSVYPSGIAGGEYTRGDISPDAKHVIACGPQKDQLLVVADWDQPTRTQEARKCDVITFAAFVKKDVFVTVARDGQVALWNMKMPEPAKQIALTKGGGATVLSADRRALYVAGGDGIHRISTDDLADVVATPEDYGAGWRVELGPKGKVLAAFSETTPIVVYQTDGMKVDSRLGGDGEMRARCAVFSPDEKTLILSHAKDPKLHFFKAPDWAQVATTDIAAPAVRIIIGPDAKWMLLNTTGRPYVMAAPKKK